MDSLRVVFLGTPTFALPSLHAIAQATTVVGVVTQPDRPSGRGRVPVAPPVAVAAREMGLRLLQPESLRSAEALAELSALRPDLLVTVAYGRLVPGAVLALPPMGCINLHPSLLPEYRGASPIQRAIVDGAASTGVTVMHLAEELDAGDIILQRRVAVGPEETAGELEARLALEGAVLLLGAVGQIARGEARRRAQDHARATYAGKLSKADGAIQWARPAQTLVNLVRAMNPWPCAHTTWRGGILKVWQARVTDGQGPPGLVLEAGEAGITVAAGEGAVALVEVQPEGGRRMPAAAFARGHRIAAGDRLGDRLGESEAPGGL
ncbi:MAG: methionyl-tRNA formyltransferase [bacterium]|nr:methionyl-tRNA formyltransferase [bacterium]